MEVSPIYDATASVDEEIIELLAKFGTNTNIGNPLSIASTQGNTKSVESPLKNEAKLDGPQWNGDSSLEYVFSNKNIRARRDMLSLIIQYKLQSTEFKNSHGQNILEKFVLMDKHYQNLEEQDVVDITKLLIGIGGVTVDEINDQKWLISSANRNNVSLVSFLVERGADVNVQSWVLKYTALYTFVLYNNFDMVDFLLTRGADINAQNSYGRTALHAACTIRNENIISLLVQNGADVNLEDCDGRSAFYYLKPAMSNYDECIFLIVKELSRCLFKNRFISTKNMHLIDTKPKARDYFEKCRSELEKMTNTVFYRPFSYSTILEMSKNIKKLALLTKNEDFVKKFKENVESFTYYKNDLRMTFDKAIQLRNQLLKVDSILCFIFGNVFPSVVRRNIGKYLTVEDLQKCSETLT